MRLIALVGLVACAVAPPGVALAQQDTTVVTRNDSVTVRLVDVELRAAVQALSQYLDRPVVFGAVNGARVNLETPAPVPRAQVVELLRGLLASQNLELFADSGGIYRVRPREERPPAPQDLAQARQSGGPVALYVIRLKHARAPEVAATVNALYGRAGAVGELGARPSTLREELAQQRVPPGIPPGDARAIPIEGQRPAVLAGEVTIVPDARTNSLLIRASPGDFALIQAAVAQVDVRPLQVLIEVVIAEVRRDRSFSFGLGAQLKETRVPGSANTTVQGTTSGSPGLADFVLKVMGVGGVDLDATLTAAAARGDVRIMSRPILLAANNETAEIVVGSQRPFIQVQRALPTDAPLRDQIVQYRDVGTQLTVRPTISADGYVQLEVTQEVNAATSEVAFDAPVISTRSVRTQLLVRDSQTVVLGGLTDRQRDVNRGGVPILSRIPLLGGLFGRSSRRTTETELFLFLTPRIIRTDAEASSVTEPLKERARRATP